jgi:hypothetical protein
MVGITGSWGSSRLVTARALGDVPLNHAPRRSSRARRARRGHGRGLDGRGGRRVEPHDSDHPVLGGRLGDREPEGLDPPKTPGGRCPGRASFVFASRREAGCSRPSPPTRSARRSGGGRRWPASSAGVQAGESPGSPRTAATSRAGTASRRASPRRPASRRRREKSIRIMGRPSPATTADRTSRPDLRLLARSCARAARPRRSPVFGAASRERVRPAPRYPRRRPATEIRDARPARSAICALASDERALRTGARRAREFVLRNWMPSPSCRRRLPANPDVAQQLRRSDRCRRPQPPPVLRRPSRSDHGRGLLRA